MKFLLKKYLIINLSLLALRELIPGFILPSSWLNFFFASFVLTLFFYFLRPITQILLFPLNLLTLNFFSWIINILIFYFWTLIIPEVDFKNWHFLGLHTGFFSLSEQFFASWQVGVICAILFTLFTHFFGWLIK